MPIPQPQSIDSDLARNLARIILNWGAIEAFAGVILEKMCGLTGSPDSAELVFALSVERKLTMICARKHKCSAAPNVIFEEIKWVNEKSRPLRNLVVHGMVHVDFDTDKPLGFVSLSKANQEISMSDIPLVAEHSAYAHRVVGALLKSLSGIPFDVADFGKAHRPRELKLKA
ncbi:hypothetical protein [Microcystis phage Mae-JY29]